MRLLKELRADAGARVRGHVLRDKAISAIADG